MLKQRERASLAKTTLVCAATTLILATCSPYGPHAKPFVRLDLVVLESQRGQRYFAASVHLLDSSLLPDARLRFRYPTGSVASVEQPPEGSSLGVEAASFTEFELGTLQGPVVIGPFVLRAVSATSVETAPTQGTKIQRSDGGAPETGIPTDFGAPVASDTRLDEAIPDYVELSWLGGSIRDHVPTQRRWGVASGLGVLRPTPTTSRILIGHEAEITAYAAGTGIETEYGVIAQKNVVEPPQPSAAVDAEIQVFSIAVTVEPDKPYLIALEVPAPRPLPPLARLEVRKAPLDPPGAPAEPATFAGTVSADGSRIVLPTAGSGRYEAYISKADYVTRRRTLYPPTLRWREVAAVRLEAASRDYEDRVRNAVVALGDAVPYEILGLLGPPSEAFSRALEVTDVAWAGPAVCSLYACIGTSETNPLVACDLTYGSVGCLEAVSEKEAVDLRVSDAARKEERCASRLCFVPGKMLADNRSREVARRDAVVFFVASDELMSFGSDVMA